MEKRPFNVKDYIVYAGHLNIYEDIAYRRLLDLYFLRESPLPLDVKKVARLIRMSEYVDCVNSVLHEFFEKTDKGWYHTKSEEELSRMRRRRKKSIDLTMTTENQQTLNKSLTSIKLMPASQWEH